MKTNPYYRDWTEHQLRAAIWNADIGIHWRGPFRVLSIRIEKKVNYFYEVTTSD